LSFGISVLTLGPVVLRVQLSTELIFYAIHNAKQELGSQVEAAATGPPHHRRAEHTLDEPGQTRSLSLIDGSTDAGDREVGRHVH
jgi:hypothetical protein